MPCPSVRPSVCLCGYCRSAWCRRALRQRFEAEYPGTVVRQRTLDTGGARQAGHYCSAGESETVWARNLQRRRLGRALVGASSPPDLTSLAHLVVSILRLSLNNCLTRVLLSVRGANMSLFGGSSSGSAVVGGGCGWSKLGVYRSGGAIGFDASEDGCHGVVPHYDDLSTAQEQLTLGAKNAYFAPVYANSDHFAKTGSGQR